MELTDEKFKVNIIFGHVEIKQFHKFENGRLVSYGYSINYDRHGKEISRTKPIPSGSIGWSNGEPFTEKDLRSFQ